MNGPQGGPGVNAHGLLHALKHACSHTWGQQHVVISAQCLFSHQAWVCKGTFKGHLDGPFRQRIPHEPEIKGRVVGVGRFKISTL